MSRSIGRQKGSLDRQGPSWVLSYREYLKDPDTGIITGVPRRTSICPASLSLKEAWKEARPIIDAENAKAAKPSMRMSVRQFYETRFTEHKLFACKPSGQKHYRYLFTEHILPDLGERRLCDVDREDVQALIGRKFRKGYSVQTLRHIKNAVSALFTEARRSKAYYDENPASMVDIPEGLPAKRATLTPDQLTRVFPKLQSPVREIALTSVATSMGPAELLGVRLKNVNLTGELAVIEGGEVLAPHSIAVRENFYDGKYGTVKGRHGAISKRYRNVPLTESLCGLLSRLVAESPRQDPDAPLFQSRNGTPIDTHNVANRVFAPLSKALGFKVTWYGFRRAHSTLAAIDGATSEDRRLIMGHANDRMQMHYDIASMERMRAVPTRIMDRFTDAVAGERDNVIEIGKKAG